MPLPARTRAAFIRAASHAAVTTPSGAVLVRHRQARALYIFPTKALAQDQQRALRSLANAGGTHLFGLAVHTYDGDTPQSERQSLRDNARVFLTNPDMLHCAILPHHAEWSRVLANLCAAHAMCSAAGRARCSSGC